MWAYTECDFSAFTWVAPLLLLGFLHFSTVSRILSEGWNYMAVSSLYCSKWNDRVYLSAQGTSCKPKERLFVILQQMLYYTLPVCGRTNPWNLLVTLWPESDHWPARDGIWEGVRCVLHCSFLHLGAGSLGSVPGANLRPCRFPTVCPCSGWRPLVTGPGFSTQRWKGEEAFPPHGLAPMHGFPSATTPSCVWCRAKSWEAFRFGPVGYSGPNLLLFLSQRE